MKTVLSIAGTDPTGGAGIQTDLKTFEAFGVYGMAVITVVCAQNTTGVFGMQPVSAELVGKQIDCVFDDIFPDAVKVGMLYDAEIIHTVAERLKAYHAKNIVLDPVMMSPQAVPTAASRCGKGSAGGAVPAVHSGHA
ncbi:MAG: bifunctional hydroxymethylpyrimidine kinase/phosphomethylpyrimidine kinase [Butyricicoccaceae bacterium]